LINMKNKVLVTGGAGFIGSHMADALIKQKRKVKILIRKREYKPYEKNFLTSFKKQGVEIVYGDLRQPKSLDAAVEGVDTIFHLGAVSRPMKILKKEYYDNSVLGTKNILIAASKAKIKRFVHVSTVSVLGVSPDGTPLREEDYQPEDMTYATSKLIGEKLALAYGNRFNIPTIVIRPCLTYGPRCMVRLVMFKFVKLGLFPLFNHGNAKMEFLYVDNCVHALMLAAKSNIKGEIFNITDGQSYMMREVLSTIADELGVKEPRVSIPVQLGVGFGYISEFVSKLIGIYPPFSRTAADWMAHSRNVYDVSKAKNILNYAPKVGLRDGVRETVDWYRTHNLL
jgi:nucleoside-diphosphate-sugar epimerase